MSGFQRIMEIEQIFNGKKILVKRDGSITVESIDGSPTPPLSELALPAEFWKNLSSMIANMNEQTDKYVEHVRNLNEVIIKFDKKIKDLEEVQKRYVPIGGSMKKNLLLAGMTMGKRIANGEKNKCIY